MGCGSGVAEPEFQPSRSGPRAGHPGLLGEAALQGGGGAPPTCQEHHHLSFWPLVSVMTD